MEPIDVHTIPGELLKKYSTPILVAQTTYYKVFKATPLLRSYETDFIRAFDFDSDIVTQNYDRAATLFLQEIIYLCMRVSSAPSLIRLENFAISGKKIAFVAAHHFSLYDAINENFTQQSPAVDVVELLKQVTYDIDFLYDRMRLSGLNLSSKTIFYERQTEKFVLNDWGAALYETNSQVDGISKNHHDAPNNSEVLQKNNITSILKNPNSKENKNLTFNVSAPALEARKAADIYSLGIIGLECCGVSEDDRRNIANVGDAESERDVLEETIGSELDKLGKTSDIKRRIMRILQKDPEKRCLEKQFRVIGCDIENNLIRICETHPVESQLEKGKGLFIIKSIAMQGPKASKNNENAYGLIKEMGNSDYIISTTSSKDDAKIGIFDMARRYKKAFSYTEAAKGSHIKDISYNERTHRAALLSISGVVSYHLFDCSDWRVPLTKSSWRFPQKNSIVTSLDFEPNGERIITMDSKGSYVLSNINTGKQLYNSGSGLNREGVKNRVRWNPATSLIALTFNPDCINLIDAVTQQLILVQPYKAIEEINWIDWRRDGMLMAFCSSNGTVKIYDIRSNKIAHTHDGIHTNAINSVRWSKDGDMIITASDDGTVKVIDVSSGFILHSFEPRTKSPAYSACFLPDIY